MRKFSLDLRTMLPRKNAAPPVAQHLASVSPWDKYPATIAEIAELAIEGSEKRSAFQALGVSAFAAAFGLVYSLRASEVLGLTLGNVLPNGSIVVHSKKHGRTHTIVLPKSSWKQEALARWPRDTPLFATTYKRMYHAARELHWFVRLPGYTKDIVLHLGRHSLANQLVAGGFGDNVSDCLNHNSLGAASWYKKEVDLKKDRERKRIQRRKNRNECK
jgi:integrase